LEDEIVVSDLDGKKFEAKQKMENNFGTKTLECHAQHKKASKQCRGRF
jgi:hypothetical protein